MKRSIVLLICLVCLVVGLACGGTSGTVAGAGDDDGGPVGESTGDGCPDDEGYTYVRAGGSYGGCTFEPRYTTLKVSCGGEFNRYFIRNEAGPVWRSDSEPSERGLSVYWPGGDGVDGQGFACVKERCFECE